MLSRPGVWRAFVTWSNSDLTKFVNLLQEDCVVPWKANYISLTFVQDCLITQTEKIQEALKVTWPTTVDLRLCNVRIEACITLDVPPNFDENFWDEAGWKDLQTTQFLSGSKQPKRCTRQAQFQSMASLGGKRDADLKILISLQISVRSTPNFT